MSLLLRTVKFNRWQFDITHNVNTFPANPLSDLAATQDTLSFYLIPTRDDISHVITSLCCTRSSISNYEYLSVDTEKLSSANFEIVKTDGTCDFYNLNELHFDLIVPTAQRLIDLGLLLCEEAANVGDNKTKKQVKSMIIDAIRNNEIPIEKINPQLRKYFEEHNLI